MKVFLSKQASKQLKKVPIDIQKKLAIWTLSVETAGLEETRKIQGYHDEKLSGNKKDRRSIRLNKAWRAEYYVETDDNGNFVLVVEIHHHDY